jgi:diguanylate cyclase
MDVSKPAPAHEGSSCAQPLRIPFLKSAALLRQELTVAMREGHLQMHYQPQVRTDDRSIVGVEALLRWQHPAFGRIPPLRFLPQIETLPFMQALTEWVIRTVLEQAAQWRSAGITLSVAINIAPVTAEDPLFPDWLGDVVARSGLPPSSIELEITERCVIRDWRRAKDVLDRIARNGVRIAIDDFGAGYSPMSHLRDFPISVLKVDRSLVSGLAGCERTASIFRSIMRLARAIAVDAVAEGVESEAVLQSVIRAGCRMAQGYYLGEPMEAALIEELYRGSLAKGTAVQPDRRF